MRKTDWLMAACYIDLYLEFYVIRANNRHMIFVISLHKKILDAFHNLDISGIMARSRFILVPGD